MYRSRDVAFAPVGQSCIASTSRRHDTHVRFRYHADSRHIIAVSIDTLSTLNGYSERQRGDDCLLCSDIANPRLSVCLAGVHLAAQVVQVAKTMKLKLNYPEMS